ncbi:hypothetical protein ABPG75_004362 [Micractinium tetrahymenae]
MLRLAASSTPPSQAAYAPSFSEHRRRAFESWDRPLIDYLTLAAPASFSRWRELQAAQLRLSMSSQATAKVFLNVLSSWRLNGGRLHDMATYAHALVACSGAPVVTALAVARPVRLWLHLLLQAAVLVHTVRCNPSLCGTPVLQHPFSRRATRSIYSALSALLSLALPAGALPAQHTPAGQCRALLTLGQFLLNFLASTIIIAAAEASFYRRWKRHWLAWQRRQAAEEARASPSSGAAGRSSGSSSMAGSSGTGATTRAAAAHKLDTERYPFLQPPGWLAARFYEACTACRLREVQDYVMAAATSALLLCSAWHIILLLTPP